MKKLLMILIIMCLLIGNGCKIKQGNEQTKVLFWHIWSLKNAQQVMNNIVQQFNKQNPDLKVIPLIVPFTETGPYIQKVLTAIAGGNPPDVLTFSGVPILAGKNALIPLDDFIKQSHFDIENFLQYRVKVVSFDEKCYGIPFSTSANSLLFYNKELFQEVGLDPDKPPSTWEELREAAKRLTIIKDGRIERLGFVPLLAQGHLYVWIWANGGEVIAEDNRTLLIDKPEAIEALEWIVKFTDEICGGIVSVGSFNQQFQGFEQGPLYTGACTMAK